jgi:hypothetical protein
VSTISVPTVNSITVDHRRLVQFMAAFFVALGYHLRIGIHTVSDLMERRFAEFAGVPCENPLSRRQWEDLWETEAEPAEAAEHFGWFAISQASMRRHRAHGPAGGPLQIYTNV